MKGIKRNYVTVAAVLMALGMAGNTARAQTQKPNIVFIMGDDIGWMQPSIYHRGLMVGETPNIDRIGNEGGIFMTYYAEQSCTAGRNSFFTGMHPLRTGMIPPQLPGSPSYLRPGTPALAWFLRDLGYNTGEFGKNHLGDHTDALPTAHGFQEFWGYLYHLDAMQGVSFPDININPNKQGIVPPCKNTPIPGLAEVPGAVDPRTTNCLTPPRNVLLCKSSDGTSKNQTCHDEGPLTLERSKGVDEEISSFALDVGNVSLQLRLAVEAELFKRPLGCRLAIHHLSDQLVDAAVDGELDDVPCQLQAESLSANAACHVEANLAYVAAPAERRPVERSFAANLTADLSNDADGFAVRELGEEAIEPVRCRHVVLEDQSILLRHVAEEASQGQSVRRLGANQCHTLAVLQMRNTRKTQCFDHARRSLGRLGQT